MKIWEDCTVPPREEIPHYEGKDNGSFVVCGERLLANAGARDDEERASAPEGERRRVQRKRAREHLYPRARTDSHVRKREKRTAVDRSDSFPILFMSGRSLAGARHLVVAMACANRNRRSRRAFSRSLEGPCAGSRRIYYTNLPRERRPFCEIRLRSRTGGVAARVEAVRPETWTPF